MDNEDPQLIRVRINRRRAVALDDVGGSDYQLVSVTSPGDIKSYALLSTAAWESKKPLPYVEIPRHEQLGRLPHGYRRRIEVVTGGMPHHRGMYCCGRPTRSGSRCKTTVTSPGLACRWHRK